MPADRPSLRSRLRGPWPRWLPWVLAAFVGSPCLLCVGLMAVNAIGQWAGVIPPPQPRAALVTATATRNGAAPRFAVSVVADRGFRVGEDYRLVIVAEGTSGSRGIAGVPRREVVYPKQLGLTADAAVAIDWTVDELSNRLGPFSVRIDRYVMGRSDEVASNPIFVP